jgi:protein tyrosine phosphatase (PTP) superfamily phosphohydrolase (DUF442 family)
MIYTRNLTTASLLALISLCCSCSEQAGPGPAGASPSKPTTTAPDVPCFAWLSPDVARGGQPKSEAAFRELRDAGITTIISVDGAKPDVETARKYGLRYVHIPFGYDGVPRELELELVRTVRELDGPFFVHCHHGKHRGPAGAVIAQMGLGGMTNAEAVAELKAAGTAPKYSGLYGAAMVFTVPDEHELAGCTFDFPESAEIPPFAEAMAVVDRRFDNLKLVQQAGWKPSAEHPDVAPAHEALQVMELFVEMGRQDRVMNAPEDFRAWFTQCETAAKNLEASLSADTPDLELAERSFRDLSQSCSQCHQVYRNTATPGAE